MPVHDPSPNFALLTSFDARQWSNVTVFEQLGYPVTLPTFQAGLRERLAGGAQR